MQTDNGHVIWRPNKMAARMSVATAAANGDLRGVEELVKRGADINERSSDGMTPLGIAAFWGYAEIAQFLLKSGADVNLANSGTLLTPTHSAAYQGHGKVIMKLMEYNPDVTLRDSMGRADVNLPNRRSLWTPIISAAFQGHGKIIMKLMEYNPDLSLTDNQGRTAVDFASAMDGIWPFFAARGCKRTPKSELIKMKIVQKVSTPDATVPRSDFAHFSRPGSAYIIRQPQMQYSDSNMALASQTGDVLAGTSDEAESWSSRRHIPSLGSVWNN